MRLCPRLLQDPLSVYYIYTHMLTHIHTQACVNTYIQTRYCCVTAALLLLYCCFTAALPAVCLDNRLFEDPLTPCRLELLELLPLGLISCVSSCRAVKLVHNYIYIYIQA